MPHPNARRLTYKNSFSPALKQRFAEEFQLDCDAKAAAARVGKPGCGAQLIALPDVQTKIAALRMRAQSHTEIYTHAVLARWWQLATADARELSHVRRVNCRHCHGADHRFQFTENGLRLAHHRHVVLGELWVYDEDYPRGRIIRALTDDERARDFDDLGGDGFDPWGDPVEDCTECGGKGKPQVWVEDSRNYSPAAALLYDGVEINERTGKIAVKHRDRGWADQMVAAHLGIAVRGSRDGPPSVDPDRMSDDQLEATIERFRLLGLIEGEQVGEAEEGVRAG